MAGISHASAGSPVQDPNTCTFWDSILDIFYEADCGSQYVGLTVRQSSQPYWKTISGLDDGDYIVEFKEKNKQKSEICFWSKTATRVQDLPNKYSLYDINGKEIVQLNRKQESDKYGYCRIVDTETYIKMNPTVVFQEDSTIQYLDVASGLEVNNTLKKFNGLEYVLAPDEVWISQNAGSLKFGANDTYATNDTQYVYELSSNKNIWHLEKDKWVVDMKGENYQIVDFDDVCRYKGCEYNLTFNNETNITKLETFFVGEFINTTNFTGIIIDPSYTSVATSGNLYNNTQYENNGNIHLDINDSGYRYAYSDDTSGNYIDISGADSTTYNNFSFSAWARVEDSEPYSSIFGPDSGFITDASGGMQSNIYSLQQIYFQLSNGSDQGYVTTTNNQVTLGQWAHIVGTYDGNTGDIKIYVDGAEATISSYISNMTGPIYLPGGTKKTHLLEYNGHWFNGSVDEVMFFDSVLNSTQVSEIYNLNRTEYNGSTTNLKHYWNFDDGPNDYTDKIGSADGTKAGTVRTIPYEPTIDTQFSSGQFNKPYDSLVAYYSFDADSSTTAYDLTNNNNDGTITGAVNTSGVYGSAKYFDGDNDVISINSFNTPYFTFNAWVKPTNLTKNLATLGTKWTGSGGLSAGGWLIDSYVSAGVFDGIRFVLNDGTARSLTAGAGNLTINEWQMITTTYDGTGLKIYKNGNLVTSSSFSGSVLPSLSQTIYLGNTGASTSQDYNGSMDEVMIFATALNSTQIQAIYNNQSKRFKEDGTVTFKPISDGGSYNQVNFSNNFSSLLNTTEERRVGFWKITNGYNVSQGNVLNSLVAYWQGDGNANDYLGVYNGSLQADANVSEYGIYNNSFSFDGSGDFVNVSDIDLSSAFTLETWVYLNSLPTTNNNYPLISKGTTNAPYVLDILNDASNRKYFRLFGYESATPKGITGSTNNYVVANQWYHVVGTFDGTSVWKIYVDGVLKDSTTSSATLTQSNENLYLGYRSSYLDGKLDDVRIWNKSLSLTEIQSLYNKGLVTNWTYSDWVQATNNQNSTIDSPDGGSYTTFSPEIRLNSNSTDGSSKFYTPYANSNLTIGLIFNPPTASFLSGTTNGSQAEGVQTIISNVSWNYASQVTTYLNYSNGTNYATITNTTSPAINIWTNVPFGDYILYAIASAGGTDANTGQNNITLSADLTNPFIEFISPTPANDTSHGGDNLLELYTNQTDVNPKNVTYYLFHDNGTLVDQHTLTWTTSPETLNWNFTIPISGTYYWYNATACDYYDNCNSTETRRVYVDFELAILDLLLPLWENLYESTYVPLSYFAYDPSGIAQVWYNVLYSSNGTNSTYISNTTISGNTTVAITDVGSYYLNLWANDTVGNVGSDLTFFDVTNVSVGPEGPQGPTGPTGPQGPQGEPGVNGTSVDLLSQICKYKKLGYYNEELPFLKEVNCV